MRRWGPIIAIVVVAAIVAALVVMGGGDDDEASDDGGDGGPTEEATDVTTEDGDPIYPFSWADGEAAGLTDELEWGERCDTERGTLAIPDRGARRRATSRSRATTAGPPTRASPPTPSRSCAYLAARAGPDHQVHHRRRSRSTTPTPTSRTRRPSRSRCCRRTTRPTAARWRSSTT